ncbi:MAG: DUF4065 domain-containing protein [Acidipropionibacterium sp.]|jgi:uncharacterized phage-associated protein|nr:DUF4065 domain-containing protein [Acidipropionibacterium sp.]
MRTDAIAAWFLSRGNTNPPAAVTNMKLQGLVYLAESCYGSLHEEPLVDQPAEAWDGPAFPGLYRTHRHCKANPIPAPTRCDPLPEDVTEVLETVWDLFGDRTAGQLQNLTHDYGPYRDHYVEEQKHTDIPVDEIHHAWPLFAAQGAARVYRPDPHALAVLHKLAAKAPTGQPDITRYNTGQLMADYRAFSEPH